MCGFAGLLYPGASTSDDLAAEAGRMAGTLTHRGPDDAGVWTDAGAGVALGFRRLAIIDLTPSGHQPMLSHDGRFAIVFNGEIYNFRELRRELESLGVGFRGSSDTEVIVEAASVWGPGEAVARLWGMFALAIWDRQARTLTLGRDRLGKKPLYVSRQGSGPLLFASELKALRAHPAFSPEIDRDALASFFRFGYVPAPQAIYRGVMKLEPGCLAVAGGDGSLRLERYWDPLAVVTRGVASRRTIADEEAVEQLDALLGDAVERRMVADVPLGAFLSGGVDSSTVVALMQARGSRSARTFTIGFDEAAYDESDHAGAIAQHLGTDHTALKVTAAETREVVPRLPDLYDEPFADSSQIPTLLVAALARRSVTVALSGDGGDELFGGYTRHLWARRVAEASGRWPSGLRSAGRRLLELPSEAAWDRLYALARPLLPRRLEQSHPGEKIRKLASVVDAPSADEVYRRLVAQWPEAERVVIGGRLVTTAIDDDAIATRLPDAVDRMMYYDLVGYLPGDILAKVDRATMGVSLEARGPLLDHRLVEWAWSLPLSLKVRDGEGKWILRRVLDRYVPRELVERPKIGFGIPVGEWLRGPLRSWAEALLDDARLRREGYLRPEPIRRVWRDHLAGRRDGQHRLWVALMFQAWLERWAR